MGEKRKYMRFNVFMDALRRKADGADKLKVSNFSREGMGVISREPFKEGDDVNIELTIPGDNIPVILEGQIAWTKDPETDNFQYRGGVRFKKIANGDRSRILEYIYQKWIMPTDFGLQQ